jgi:Beta-propeller repeat
MNPMRCPRHLVETALIILIAPSMVAAQSIEWIRQIGTPESESAYAISADTLGNVFMSGFTRGGLGAASAYGRDPFFTKYDSSGNLIWTRQLNAGLGESAWGISADGLGNVYVQGDTSDSLFGPSAGSFDVSADNSRDAIYLAGSFDGTEQFGAQTLVATPGNTDAFLSRLDAATGDFEWTIRSTGKGHEHVWGMAIDATDGPDGTAYLTGRGYDDVAFGSTKWRGGYSGFVAKVPLSESGGSFQWAKPISSRTSKNALIESREVAIWNHNVLVTGHTAAKDVQLGALTITNLHVNTHDIFVTQVSASGNFHWAFFAGSSGSDYPIAMAADTFGNLFLTGSVGGTAAFGSDTVPAGSFVSQLGAATGQFIKSWGFSEGAVTTGNTVRALATSSTGNLLVTGGFVGTMTFPGGITLTSTNNTRDTFVLEFAPATGVNVPRLLLTSAFRESDNVQTRALKAFLDEEALPTSFRRQRKMLAIVSPTILGFPNG